MEANYLKEEEFLYCYCDKDVDAYSENGDAYSKNNEWICKDCKKFLI
jgi:hypothetical protein